MKIDAAADETEKFKAVFNQLHGIDQYSDLDQQKILVFHETVITPLTTLFFVYLWLDDFNRFFNSLCLPAAADSPEIFRNVVANPAAMADLILDHNYARLKGQGSPYTRNGDASRILLTPAELERYL